MSSTSQAASLIIDHIAARLNDEAYTEAAVASDGAAILYYGQPITISQVLARLNALEALLTSPSQSTKET